MKSRHSEGMKKMYQTILEYYAPLLEDALKTCLCRIPNEIPVMREAMEYAVLGAGKRIRPVLTMEFCRACGGKAEDALPFACSLELIHSYSLVHDDLPCMDDDAIRRGKPSVHKAYGEDMALLAGDALLTYAFEWSLSQTAAAPERQLAALRILAQCAGVDGMIGGQVLDLRSEGRDITVEELRNMHRLKTGALISAACRMGVAVAGGSREEMSAAEEYANRVGLVFQVIDDILDCTSDTQTLGKPVGSDAANHKNTYATLMGIGESRALAQTLTREAIKQLDVFKDKENLIWIANMLLDRKK